MHKVKDFISQFTDKEIINIVKIGRSYFLAGEEQKRLSEKINQEMFSIGIFLGESKKEFKPSPALIDIIARLSDKKVFITKKAEWLFLCRRDVFEKNIVKKNVEKGLVLVQNNKDENIGYGRIVTKGKKIFIKNLLDKGYYLRREN